jgi:hypothetical protein
MKEQLRDLIGHVPASDDAFKKRMRIHQGWWRAFVLAEPEGEHPIDANKTVCNTLRNGKDGGKNFLTQHILNVVNSTIEERQLSDKGLIERDRLFNNLLSSQPLCFNFFGELALDKKLALEILQHFFPLLTEVEKITFEFAPSANYTDDNSAFDVAIKVTDGDKNGLIGLECKYTDSFSPEKYSKDAYRKIFDKSSAFKNEYKDYIQSRFNQLFRNQLIAEALIQNNKYGFVRTGLFCHEKDRAALTTAQKFQEMLNDGDERFRIITYQQFIEAMQKLELTWDQRELSMLLWVRYCGLNLSEEISKEFM